MTTVEPAEITDEQWRTWWRKKLESAVETAWMRRNGPTGKVTPFDTGTEFMEMTDDIEVYPMWGHPEEDGRIRGWSNHPIKNGTGAWDWRDTMPPDEEWINAHEDEDWMGMIDGDDGRVSCISWIVNAPHDQPPPVPEDLISYLVAAQNAR